MHPAPAELTEVEILEETLNRLLAAKPETGAAWADICEVEQMLINARAIAAWKAA